MAYYFKKRFKKFQKLDLKNQQFEICNIFLDNNIANIPNSETFITFSMLDNNKSFSK